MNLTTVEDARAALLCDLAAVRLRDDRERMRELIKELQALGYARPLEAAERVGRVAIDEERGARG